MVDRFPHLVIPRTGAPLRSAFLANSPKAVCWFSQGDARSVCPHRRWDSKSGCPSRYVGTAGHVPPEDHPGVLGPECALHRTPCVAQHRG